MISQGEEKEKDFKDAKLANQIAKDSSPFVLTKAIKKVKQHVSSSSSSLLNGECIYSGTDPSEQEFESDCSSNGKDTLMECEDDEVSSDDEIMLDEFDYSSSSFEEEDEKNDLVESVGEEENDFDNELVPEKPFEQDDDGEESLSLSNILPPGSTRRTRPVHFDYK